mmetsp:Transcript_42784/g.109482  ORF Transcript_42784/g.109482 Transcript_42784/m.109482 type:complete len:231 (-) Transcript_42784:762-1454(-)|eukprot:jgi/Tetstr1/429596/TSEL_019495.t1
MFGGPDEICTDIYLGGFLALDACHRRGIHNVLSLVDAESHDQIKEILGSLLDGSRGGPALTVCHIDVEDKSSANLLQHLDTAMEFMEAAIASENKVLVHCMAGVSRSATTVAAYLVKHNNLSPEDAVALVKEKRRCADPNSGFLKQLAAWHAMGCKVDKGHPRYKELFGKPSVVKSASMDGSMNNSTREMSKLAAGSKEKGVNPADIKCGLPAPPPPDKRPPSKLCCCIS